ncbi:GDP-mannose mannosyl hydrolase [Lelliottia wanjuensis]|uniref:GDP-mannose mannosyl hydrolase n=1 Tax=Lelliottia wanjuensis TaxID=3050585 RepID=UPI00390838A3
MRLDRGLFQLIVKNTPLISIDLIVKNNQGKVLLGQRLNQPAKGYWFVPGGRVFKDELLDEAFRRTGREELGLEINIHSAKFVGVYEHFYADNFSGNDFTTHYVVHCYEILVDDQQLLMTLPLEQHDRYQWFDIKDLLVDASVHLYTQNYFISR